MKRVRLWPLAVLLLLPTVAFAGGPRVVVFPFEIYNAPELVALAPGLQSMFASRLSGSGYSVDTASGKEAREAEWSVRTTITHLGSVYSIDAALLASVPRGEGTRTYETAKSTDAILPALESMARRLKEDLGRIAASAPPPAPEAAREALPAKPPAAIEPVPTPAARPEPAPTPAIAKPPAPKPEAAAPDLTQIFSTQRLGPPVSGQAKSIAVADADRDGTPEILLMTDDVIYAFRDQGGALVRAWESPVPRGFAPLALSVGDIDRNGVPEVFIAGMDRTAPASQALEWFGSALAPKGDRINAFVRAVSAQGQEPQLLGMEGGLERSIFARGVRSFAWTGRSYKDQGKAAVPSTAEAVNLSLLVLDPGNRPFTAVTSQGGRLLIYGPDGEEVYGSGDRVQGSMNLIVGQESLPDRQDEDIVQIQGKIVAWRAPGGVPTVLVPKNHASLTGYFGKAPTYSSSQILGFRWTETTLLQMAETTKQTGYIPDLDLGPPVGRPGGATLYAPLVQGEGMFFNNKAKTLILAYDLPGEVPSR